MMNLFQICNAAFLFGIVASDPVETNGDRSTCTDPSEASLSALTYHSMLSSKGYAGFHTISSRHPDGYPISFAPPTLFIVLACGAAMLLSGQSAMLRTEAAFWQEVTDMSRTPVEVWWNRHVSAAQSMELSTTEKPYIVAAGPDRDDFADAEVVLNQRWWAHEPAAGILRYTVGAVLGAKDAVALDCPSSWPLAILLKVEADLAVMVDEIYKGVEGINLMRARELLDIMTEYRAEHKQRNPIFSLAINSTRLEDWLPLLTVLVEARANKLSGRLLDLIAGPPIHFSGSALEEELTRTWVGLDRFPVTASSSAERDPLGAEPPPELRVPTSTPGFACVWRTDAMRHLERLPLRHREKPPDGSDSVTELRFFWARMAEAYEALFGWRLATLGSGAARLLLWRGVAVIERNFSYTWSHCAPAAIVTVIARADRWLARMSQANIWGDTNTQQMVTEDMTTMPGYSLLSLARSNIAVYGQMRQRLQLMSSPMPRRWADTMDAAENRLRDRMETWTALGAMPAGVHLKSPEITSIRMQLERYMCHSTLGIGVLPLLVNQPTASLKLIHAGVGATRARWRMNWRARSPSHGIRKLAFLLMVYDRPSFTTLWRLFLRGAKPRQYRVFVHASKANVLGQNKLSNATGGTDDETYFDKFRISWRPSAWFNISHVIFGLFRAALRDTAVQKAFLLSQDTIPLTTFSAVHSWALADQARSWFCLDHEYTRSEPWMLLTRRHMQALTHQRTTILHILEGSGMCDAEEMVLQALYLLREHRWLRNRCVVFTQWALPKYFATGRPPVLDRPPALIGEYEHRVGSCGHPTTFEELHDVEVQQLLRAVAPDRYWFARKFTRDATTKLGIGGRISLEDFLVRQLFSNDSRRLGLQDRQARDRIL